METTHVLVTLTTTGVPVQPSTMSARDVEQGLPRSMHSFMSSFR